MGDSRMSTLEQVGEFFEGPGSVGIEISSKAERQAWVRRTLIRFAFLVLGGSLEGFSCSTSTG